MKLSMNWISDYISLDDISVDEIVKRLTLSTCEIEEIYGAFDHLDSVVTGLVTEKKPHPQADRLSICQVDVGKERLQIVCGAANVKEGVVVPVALIGAALSVPDKETKEPKSLVIKESSIRGTASFGMLCSAQELSLHPFFGETNGLLLLNEGNVLQLIEDHCRLFQLDYASNGTVKTGIPLSRLFPFKDQIIDIDNKSITHRPDLWCHFGFAREIAAVFKKPLKASPFERALPKETASLGKKDIRIEKGAAKAYFGAYIAEVEIKPSPLYIQARLANVGQKLINNAVDASNYVMFDIGQPNHAFDANVLKNDTISVLSQTSKTSFTEFTALDQVKRSIPDGSVVIVDGTSGGEIVALGGIIGGLNSGVSENTKRLFLESATFPREKIRKTLSAVQLRTDSAVRFEKGQDPSKAKIAIGIYFHLLQISSPKIKLGPICGDIPEKEKENIIEVSVAFLQKRLGFAIGIREIKDILERLHFKIHEKNLGDDVVLLVHVPTYRSEYDITIPEDIVEEIGRIYGYDNVKPQAPEIPCAATPVYGKRAMERKIKEYFCKSLSFIETYNYSFAKASTNAHFGDGGLRLKNPVSEKDRMRMSLLPGLLEQTVVNQDRFEDVRLFEYGRIYIKDAKKPVHALPDEHTRLGFVMIPAEAAENTYAAFLQLRLGLESLLTTILGQRGRFTLEDIPKSQPCPDSLEYMHPGCRTQMMSGDLRLAAVGMLHPAWEKEFGLKRRGIAGELYIEHILERYEATRRERTYSPPSVFPYSNFDLSVLLNATESTAQVVRIVESMHIPELQDIGLVTTFEGEPLPAGKFSASYRLTLGSKQGPISAERGQAILSSIVDGLAKQGYPLR